MNHFQYRVWPAPPQGIGDPILLVQLHHSTPFLPQNSPLPSIRKALAGHTDPPELVGACIAVVQKGNSVPMPMARARRTTSGATAMSSMARPRFMASVRSSSLWRPRLRPTTNSPKSA